MKENSIEDRIEEKYTRYLNYETDIIDLTLEEAIFILETDKKYHYVDDLLQVAYGMVLSDYIREIDDKEVSDALHMLLHCSLKDTEYETQKQQFKIVNAYIKKLEKENEELKYTYDKALSDVITKVELDKTYISKQKIKDKIEELKSYKGLVIYERCNYESQIKTLQDLLESEGK